VEPRERHPTPWLERVNPSTRQRVHRAAPGCSAVGLLLYVPHVSKRNLRLFFLVLLGLLPARALPAEPPERVVRVTGDTAEPVHLAAGRATALTFETAPRSDDTKLEGASVPFLVTEAGVVLFPAREAPASASAVLVVGLPEGARIRVPLTFVPGAADARVRLVRARATADPEASAAPLPQCESPPSDDALARYLLEHGSDSSPLRFRDATQVWGEAGPVTFVQLVEDHAAGRAHLLLRARRQQPLAVLRWTLTDAADQEVPVLQVLSEDLTVPADRDAYVVVSFRLGNEPRTLHLQLTDGSALHVDLELTEKP